MVEFSFAIEIVDKRKNSDVILKFRLQKFKISLNKNIWLIIGTELVRNKLLSTIPILSTEWIVSFDYKVTRTVWTDCNWLGVLTFTIGQDLDNYGDRTPSLYVRCADRQLVFSSAINGIIAFNKMVLQINSNGLYHIEIHQRYISGGEYRYFIRIDGVEVVSVVNKDARQFYNVKVYACDPWFDPADGIISNLQHTNFL